MQEFTRCQTAPPTATFVWHDSLWRTRVKAKPGHGWWQSRTWGRASHSTHCLHLPAPTHPLNFLHPAFSEIPPHMVFPWLHSSPSWPFPHISSHGPASPLTASLQGCSRPSCLLSSTSSHSLLRNWFTPSMPCPWAPRLASRGRTSLIHQWFKK